MVTRGADGVSHRRRELWLRQLMRKWGGLSNHGSSGFNRDTEMDDVELKPEEGEIDSREDLEEDCDVDIQDVEQPVDLDAIAGKPALATHPSLVRGQSETLRQQFIDHHQYRVAVRTWNVAGKSPPDDLDLEEWINISHPADIYVFGFQEVVPLNANNILCVEDEGPAALWEAKIREKLNKNTGHHKLTSVKSPSVPPSPRHVMDMMVTDVPEVSDVERLLAELSSKNFEESAILVASEEVILHNKETASKQGSKPLLQRSASSTQSAQNGERSWRAHLTTPHIQNEADVKDGLRSLKQEVLLAPIFPWNDMPSDGPAENSGQLYSRVASKQMVGLFITVWIRSHLWHHVHNVQVSKVGCGLMNHLGNKGSISVSMFLHYTSFCFVCSHLTSGHKEGDVLRRNADVAEILRRTRFPRLAKLLGLGLPETILAHDRAIWLGDLNYRLALPDKEIWSFVNLGDWSTLLRMDQLKLEQGEGRVFVDWHEGPICFPPTYKYMNGSDQYSSGNGISPSTCGASSKRRSPAWCDRVLWYGQGLQQLDYTREDSKLSDHRSVSATFSAEVEVVSRKKLKKACVYPANHELDVRCKVVPMVKPVIDVQKIQHNEVWSTLLRTLTPRRPILLNMDIMNTRSDLRGLLDQDAWIDANEATLNEDGHRNLLDDGKLKPRQPKCTTHEKQFNLQISRRRQQQQAIH